MNTNIPTQADFQLAPKRNADLDAWHAWETFGGRTLNEAYDIFRENTLFYQEAMMWMAPKPFCFYLPIVLRYLQSEDSHGDSDVINCMWSNIEFHLESGYDISAAFSCIRAICEYVLSHYSKYDVTEKIYGDLRPRYKSLLQRIGEPSATPNGCPVAPVDNSNVLKRPPSLN